MALEHKHQRSEEDPPHLLTLLTEIIIEILLRLPVDSLLWCKSVCKSWRSLISDPHFVKSHLAMSTRNNNLNYAHHRLIFSTMQRTVMETCVSDALYDNSLNALELDYPSKPSNFIVSIVGCCNGLVCIAVKEDVRSTTLFIWNPSTRKSNRLPPTGFKRQLSWFALYGFGYQQSNDDYKVVELSCNDKGRVEFETFVKIYSLKSGNWKKFGASIRIFPFPWGKFSNGALHWAAKIDFGSRVIFSLDLAKETHGEVLLPVCDEGVKQFTLGSLKEWFCVLCDYPGIRADLWVMKVYGVKESWAKLVSFPYLTDPGSERFFVPFCVSNDGKFLLQFGWKKLIVYDSKNSSFSELQNLDSCLGASIFVESLVSPMSAAGLGDI